MRARAPSRGLTMMASTARARAIETRAARHRPRGRKSPRRTPRASTRERPAGDKTRSDDGGVYLVFFSRAFAGSAYY